MKIEDLGKCPCCFVGKGVRAITVNFFTSRHDNGDLHEIYLFGDDDCDLPSSNSLVNDVKFSDDKTRVTEVVCPRCKENILVDIPIVKEQAEFFKSLSHGAAPLQPVAQNVNQL